MLQTIISGIITIIVTIFSTFKNLKGKQLYNLFSSVKFLGKQLFLSSFLTIMLYLIFLLVFVISDDKNIILIISAIMDLIVLFTATIFYFCKVNYLNYHAMEIAHELKVVKVHNQKAFDEMKDLNESITKDKSENTDYDDKLKKLKAIEFKHYSKRTRIYLFMAFISSFIIPSIFMFWSVMYALEGQWIGVLVFIVITILINMTSINEDANILFKSNVFMTNKMNKKHIAKYERQKFNNG